MLPAEPPVIVNPGLSIVMDPLPLQSAAWASIWVSSITNNEGVVTLIKLFAG